MAAERIYGNQHVDPLLGSEGPQGVFAVDVGKQHSYHFIVTLGQIACPVAERSVRGACSQSPQQQTAGIARRIAKNLCGRPLRLPVCAEGRRFLQARCPQHELQTDDWPV